MCSNQILFTSNSNTITEKKLYDLLKSLGVKKGDTLMIHSKLFTIGRIGEIQNKDLLVNTIIDILIESVGKKGTLIFPSFTIKDFCQNGFFSLQETQSRTGIIGEIARKRIDALRIPHPIYSSAVIGLNKKRFLKADITKCFGHNSFFDLLHQEGIKSGKVKFMTIGIDCPPNVITYLHCLEEKMKVPYRFYKEFMGKVIDNDIKRSTKIQMFVRDIENNVEFCGEKCWKLWKQKNIATIKQLGNTFICLLNERDLFKITCDALQKDTFLFCRNEYLK